MEAWRQAVHEGKVGIQVSCGRREKGSVWLVASTVVLLIGCGYVHV